MTVLHYAPSEAVAGTLLFPASLAERKEEEEERGGEGEVGAMVLAGKLQAHQVLPNLLQRPYSLLQPPHMEAKLTVSNNHVTLTMGILLCSLCGEYRRGRRGGERKYEHLLDCYVMHSCSPLH